MSLRSLICKMLIVLYRVVRIQVKCLAHNQPPHPTPQTASYYYILPQTFRVHKNLAPLHPHFATCPNYTPGPSVLTPDLLFFADL